MVFKKLKLALSMLIWLPVLFLGAQEHPKLILTKTGVDQIRQQLGKLPLLDKTVKAVKEEVDIAILNGIDVPVPKDYSGGYTHETHKKNYRLMQQAGVLYQILEDETYAIYVHEMLKAYAELYPTLPIHPKERSYARGKLFWQCLNDSNWLVYTSQAYDCIYDFLDKKDRKYLENKLFKPFADFISIKNPQFFNRIHNHSTWGNVAVGMIALAMEDDALLERALYGIKDAKLAQGLKDNDGGYIIEPGKAAGFFANLDEPFSPDGYYTEGPYYQRYAMYPFLIFAQALQNVKPEVKVFEYNNGVLLKSVYALLQLSDKDGEFFSINDGQKGMSYYSNALVNAVDIGYFYGGKDASLLSIAKEQNTIVLNDAGLAVAMGIKAGQQLPFIKESVAFTDGAKGDEGGIAVLRKNDLELVYKYTAQGLSHGHYDKLSYSLYEDGEEVIQDYGLARFVNIEQKGGGNYLKENKTWAKQTIAHNTLVQDQESHFGGAYEVGSKHHSNLVYATLDQSEVVAVRAKEENAYPGTKMVRTMAIVQDSTWQSPVILDIMEVQSKEAHQYDMPLYYLGQPMTVSVPITSAELLKPLGAKNGYQHLYKEAVASLTNDNLKFSWLQNQRFYTVTAISTNKDSLVMGRTGANDPEFNLRRDPVLIQRRNAVANTVFVSTIESHGTYSPVSELAVNATSTIQKIEVILQNEDYLVTSITKTDGSIYAVAFSKQKTDKSTKHNIAIKGKQITWQGPCTLINLN
ncbi:alginate lyase family protein [Croceivirga sp. JEA036]|uniref:alginate lyase family protein n=1 Tax=Croceivirga sp. JEA036 TaxID=2721162 RepID=UPI0014390FC3|nr:alginate lyase family protein [Croceivirga sp. JEA036]NJB37686.1 alginate lyase family protein [Croceivirga sp. JEA036]